MHEPEGEDGRRHRRRQRDRPVDGGAVRQPRMRVVVSDVDQAGIDAAVAAVEGLGEAIGVRTDVSQRAEVEALAGAAVDAFGGVHVVCNNAGVVVGGRVEDLTEEGVALGRRRRPLGPVYGVRGVSAPARSPGRGPHRLDGVDLEGSAPLFNAPYSVAKAGVIALMETVRGGLDDRGSPVGASVLCPGPVATPLIEQARWRLALWATVRARPRASASTRRPTPCCSVGVAPDAVAGMVVDAVRTNRFWILTPPRLGRRAPAPHRGHGHHRRAHRPAPPT